MVDDWLAFHEYQWCARKPPSRAGQTEEPRNQLQGKKCENIFPLASPEIEKMQQK